MTGGGRDPAQRFIVRGRVQGVGFRWFVLQEAIVLDLGGFVQNLPDGSVEVVASGPETALGQLAQLLSHGPRGARVDSVEKSDVSHDIKIPKPFDVQ